MMECSFTEKIRKTATTQIRALLADSGLPPLSNLRVLMSQPPTGESELRDMGFMPNATTKHFRNHQELIDKYHKIRVAQMIDTWNLLWQKKYTFHEPYPENPPNIKSEPENAPDQEEGETPEESQRQPEQDPDPPQPPRSSQAVPSASQTRLEDLLSASLHRSILQMIKQPQGSNPAQNPPLGPSNKRKGNDPHKRIAPQPSATERSSQPETQKRKTKREDQITNPTNSHPASNSKKRKEPESQQMPISQTSKKPRPENTKTTSPRSNHKKTNSTPHVATTPDVRPQPVATLRQRPTSGQTSAPLLPINKKRRGPGGPSGEPKRIHFSFKSQAVVGKEWGRHKR